MSKKDKEKTLIDTDNSKLVTPGEENRGVVKGKGSQMHGEWRRFYF